MADFEHLLPIRIYPARDLSGHFIPAPPIGNTIAATQHVGTRTWLLDANNRIVLLELEEDGWTQQGLLEAP